MDYKRQSWENPHVSLNLRHFSGDPADVIKLLKREIVNAIHKNQITSQKQIEIYSAIYNALNLYKDLTVMPGADYDTDSTYLSSAIKNFNEDFSFLAQKYNTPENPNCIQAYARIKSPIKYMEKVIQKINEYLSEGRDLKYFNESMRDVIGIRFIITPPKFNLANPIEEKEAESQFFYDVFYDLMKYRGINNPDDEELTAGDYRFLDVNTRYDKTKLQRIKERPEREGFSPVVLDELKSMRLFIPSSRPKFMEHIDRKVKDYFAYPKYMLYQALHVCVIPDYAYEMEHLDVPSGIIPPATQNYAMEYQFRTYESDLHAEKGKASHSESYKPHEKEDYHRLLVPFYIDFEQPGEREESQHNPDGEQYRQFRKSPNELGLRSFGESYTKFYGHPFEERFGLPFKELGGLFTREEIDGILARRLEIVYEGGSYIAVPSQDSLCTSSDNIGINLSRKQSPIERLDELGASDCIIHVYSDTKGEVFSKYERPKTPIKVFTIRKISPPTRRKKRDDSREI